MLKTLFTNYNPKKQEHLQNIAIKFLDIDSLQSRGDSPFFAYKKAQIPATCKDNQAGICA